MRKVIMAISIGLLFVRTEAQHFFQTTQFVQGLLLINPAYTGSREHLSLHSQYRKQWSGLQGAPQTTSFTAHAPLRNPKNNLGMVFFHDAIGVSNQTGFQGTYAYRIIGDKVRFSMGLSAGLMLGKNYWTRTVLNDPDDQAFIRDSPLLVTPLIGTGLYLDHPRYFMGLSAPFLVKAPVNAAPGNSALLSRPYILTGGCILKLNPDIKLRPSALLKYVETSPPAFDLAASFIIRDFVWLGTSWRVNDAVALHIHIQPNSQFLIGYSYDYTLSRLRPFQSGTHEISLRYDFDYSLKGRNPRYF